MIESTPSMTTPTDQHEPVEGDVPGVRTRLLTAAEDLFAELGYFGVSTRVVAARVGINKASLFHHFPSKTALYDGVLLRALDRIEVNPQDVGTGDDRVAWLEALVDTLTRNPATSRLLLRALFEKDQIPRDDPSSADRIVESLDRVLAMFRRAVRGSVNGRAVSAGELVQTLIGSTVFHYASRGLGERILGENIFEPEAIRRHKAHLRRLLGIEG